MAKAMVESIVDVGVGGGVVLLLLLLLMLLLIILLILFACKPWRFFLSSSSRTRITIINPSSSQVDDIERPLVSEDLNLVQNQSNEFGGNFSLEGVCHSTEGHFSSPQTHGVGYRQRIPSTSSQLSQSGSFVLDVIPDPLKDIFIGQTLKHPKKPVEEERYARNDDLKVCPDSGSFNEFIPEGIADERSSLTLEIISGPSRGLRCSIQSTDASRLPLILGRVAPSELLLKDSEVSGKHVLINWNLNKLKWEVVDMGSLNGTLLNSQAIHHLDSTSRRWGLSTDLANGDIITLGTSTKIFVQITSQAECLIPFGVGLASDPMAVRRGGKKLPMEDVYYYRWPLPGADKFGIFGICDGHGGAGAATSASKILPEVVASILSDSFRRENVLSQCDASDVLRDAFLQTEASLNHYYEGCTATVLLVWTDSHENFFAQCANVGDSSCVMNIDGKQIKMSEDHRIASYSERLRMQETGEPLKDGETRLCGLNLGRMLGDKFLKQQDARFSSDPYISQVVHIHQASRGFALIASDGFWDVVNSKKANQLVQQARERYAADRENPAEKVASFLLSEARTQRTKDNTSIIFLDFDNINRNSSCKPDS
ncbi:protein phosphatase 2C 70-like [Camellia sinensis]|uniref:protein phosphatase 2C 70-like n=1 Tax=Camellia sinensis TaxID=4442 RepID=UPI001035C9EA|nr:protein phosphatase 2C 70-like [Camellia sinensis]